MPKYLLYLKKNTIYLNRNKKIKVKESTTMKISSDTLKRIIKEEVRNVVKKQRMNENFFGDVTNAATATRQAGATGSGRTYRR